MGSPEFAALGLNLASIFTRCVNWGRDRETCLSGAVLPGCYSLCLCAPSKQLSQNNSQPWKQALQGHLL